MEVSFLKELKSVGQKMEMIGMSNFAYYHKVFKIRPDAEASEIVCIWKRV